MSPMQDAQRKTTRETAMIMEARVRATSHVRKAPTTEKKAGPLPTGCEVLRLEGEETEDGAGMSFFMDDAISVDVQWEEDG